MWLTAKLGILRDTIGLRKKTRNIGKGCVKIDGKTQRKWKRYMNDMLKNIFAKYLKCYEAIQILHDNGIFNEEEKSVHEHNLLHSIMIMVESEV